MSRTTRLHARRLLAIAALLAAAGGAILLAGRGEASNLLTLQTIAVDGDVGDWDAILANALQTTHDGDGSSGNITADCALYSTDRDCPLGGGAGNDLYTFAWTYDATHVYLYIERYGSAANGVDFFFVADTNQDTLVKGTGDVVIHANWAGTTGTVKIDAGAYTPVDVLNGDAIVSPTGYVDGYDLPGGNEKLSDVTCGTADGVGVTVGADAGRKMELRIPWCAFGVAPQQPFYWHVVSCNNASLATPLDNIGAPSGGLGSFVQRAVALFPDRNGAVLSPGSVTYDHTLRNDGNEADVFQFTATSSQGGMIELLDELNNVIGRDDEGDGTWELTPQVSLALGASRALHVRLTLPAGRAGQDVTRLTAFSANAPTVTATVTDSSHVGSPAFVPETFVAWTQPEIPAAFSETLANGQLVSDTFDLTVDGGCLGDEVRITADSAGTQLAARDDGGDGTWDFVDPTWDSNGNSLPDRAVPGQSATAFWLWVTPPAGAPNGTCTLRLAASSPTTLAAAHADHALTVAPAVTFGPSYTRAAGTALRAGVGGSVFFPAVIRNSESTPRAYDLAQVLTPAGSGATARVWSDPDGDGSPSDGQVITSTGTIAGFGGTQAVVIEIQAGTAPSGSSLSLATTATATSGGAAAAQTSEADVGFIATYADALRTQASSVFPPCATVYVHGSGLESNDTSSYSLTWLTPTATTAREVVPWPTTILGTADDSYALGPTALTGSWTARLVDGPSTRDQNLSFAVELNASVSALTTDKTRYRAGELVQVTGAFRDAGRVALEAGSFHYVLEGVPLRTRSGVTVAAGATVSDPFTFTLPAGTTPGVQTLSAGWWLSCGTVAFATRNQSFEVQPDPPVITAPVAGARTADAMPAIGGTAIPFAKVIVTLGGVTHPSVTALDDGTWSFTPPVLADGPWTVTATQAVPGLSGDVTSDPSAPVTFEVDTTPPAVPTIAAIASPTSADPILVEVTAPGAASVTIYRDGAVLSTPPPGVAGDVHAFELSLAEGTWSIQARAADDLGNASALSAAQSVTVDRTPPPAPAIAGYTSPQNGAVVPVTATATAGSVVRLHVDGSYDSTLVEGPAGTFTGDVAPALDGGYELTATAADAADNTSVPSAPVTLLIDRSPPAAPIVGALVPVAPSQTNANPAPIVVTAEAGATVVLVVDGTPRPTLLPVFTAPDQYRFDLPVTTGLHTISATATDVAGNPNDVPSNELTLDVDLDPPAVPTVEPIASPTNAQPVPVTVTAEAGSTVALTVDGAPAAATLVDAAGTTYSFTLVLAEGTFALRATAEDALGNTSAASSPVSVTVDRTKPGIPSVTSGIPTLTRTPLVTVTGAAEAGSSVTATVTGPGLVPTPAPVSATGGLFSLDLDFLAAASIDGDYQVVLRATDAAGNVSDPTPAATVTLDRTAPDAPVIPAIPESASPVVIHVVAEAGATVVLTIDGVAHPEILAASSIGTDYDFEVPLADGPHTVEATATDAAGNTSDPSTPQPFTVNSAIPDTPTIAVLPFVASTTFPVTVTADPGMAAVVLFVGGVDAGLTATEGPAGTYAFSLTRGEGTWVLTAKAQSGTGVWSAESAARVVVVDTTPPAAAPTITPALPARTNATSLTVAGATEPWATVTVRVAGVTVGTTTADAAGAWSVVAPLPAGDGATAVTVQAADRAGNLSPESAPVQVEVDRSGPAAPTIDPPLPAITSAAGLTVAGATEANAAVTVAVTGMTPVTTTADGGGAWSVSVLLPATDGSVDVTVRAADDLGNLSPATTVSVLIDRSGPTAAPTIDPPLPAITSAASLTVAGATEADATVTIRVTGMPDVTTSADPSGDYAAPVPLPAVDGLFDVTVSATDLAGNGSPSTTVQVEVDRTGPATPTISPALPAITRAASVTVAGATEPNATVSIQVTGMSPVTTTADGAGLYSASVPLPASDGPVDVTVQAADALGNPSPPSAPETIEIDRTGPATAPTISPALPAATSAASLTVAGTTEPGATVTIQVTGLLAVATTADAAGAWSVSVPLPAVDGNCDVTATATDLAGNVSPTSTPVTVRVDRTGPATAPTIDPALPARTNVASLTVAGSTEADATVTVRVTGLPPVTTTADGSGGYSVAVPLPAADGSCSVTAQAADALGNLSPISAPVGVVVDRTAPASAPSMDPLPALTNAPSLTVSGTTEGNATVTIQVTGLPPVTTVADGAGNYAAVVPLPAADGAYAVTVMATDVAGNASPVSPPAAVEVDRTPPAAAPVVSPPLPAATSAAIVTVAGATEPNATVAVLVDGALAVTTSADGAGVWSVGVALPPADGAYDVQVRAWDLAGNASPLSAPSAIVLDRTGPAAPTIAPALPVATNAASLTVAGVTEAGATVTVLVTGMTAVTTTADGGGGYSAVAPLPATDGAVDVTVQAADALGNLSPVSTPVSVLVDRTGPATAPTISPALPAITRAASVTVAGVTEPNATVSIQVTGMSPVTTPADGAGLYSASVPLPASDGPVDVTVHAADALGNLSPISAPAAIQIDRTAPGLAVIAAPSAGASLPPGSVTIGGTAEAGATVAIVVDGAAPVEVMADAGSGDFQLEVALDEGNHFVTVTVIDAAGNVSGPADRSFVVATPPASAGGGGCGCGSNGANAPEALLLAGAGLLAYRRRRTPAPSR